MGKFPDGPLAGLSDYGIDQLPFHLVRAGRLGDLHRLLGLRAPDGSNAWYAAKRTADRYLADLSLALDGAAAADDISSCLRYALISDKIRSSAAIPGPLLAALVARAQVPFEEALSLARSGADLRSRIEGLASLLSQAPDSSRSDLTGELLSAISASASTGQSFSLLVLAPAILDALGAIARAGVLDDDTRRQLIVVPKLMPTRYGAVRGYVTIADCLDPRQREDILEPLWLLASSLASFEGRPEAQAAVAAKLFPAPGGERIAQALATVVAGILQTEERLRYSWFPYGRGSSTERPRLLRVGDFVAPLRELASVLDEAQARSVAERFGRQTSFQAQFAVAAVLPRLAELGFADEAWQAAGNLAALRPVAVAALRAAGAGPTAFADADALGLLQKASGDAAARVLAQMAVAELLSPAARTSAIRLILQETRSELPGRTSLRPEVIDRLRPLIRSLPADPRDQLVTEIYHGKPPLVSSREEAEEILQPLSDVLPQAILHRQFAASRSVGVTAGDAALMFRHTPARDPSKPRPTEQLNARLSREALALAAAAGPADRAEILVFLAPLLDPESLPHARRLAAQIELPNWRPEPLWRLAAAEADPGTADQPGDDAQWLDALFRFGSDAGVADRATDRIRHLIDEVVAHLGKGSPRPGPNHRRQAAQFLRSGPRMRDLAQFTPIILALGGNRPATRPVRHCATSGTGSARRQRTGARKILFKVRPRARENRARRH